MKTQSMAAAAAAFIVAISAVPAFAQDSTASTMPGTVTEPAAATEEHDDGFDLGWLGLIGLAGLLGLRRKKEDVVHRPAGSTTASR